MAPHIFGMIAVASTLVILASAGPCCDVNSGGLSAGLPKLQYSLSESGVEQFSGQVGVAYSSDCGACVTATFSLNSAKGCTSLQGPTTALKSYTCTFYASVIVDYVSSKEKRRDLPCNYYTEVYRKVNATFLELCSTQHLGVGSAVFTLSGPKAAAEVTCKNLVAQPRSCDTYRDDD